VRFDGILTVLKSAPLQAAVAANNQSNAAARLAHQTEETRFPIA
jgi:hypothetical protein